MRPTPLLAAMALAITVLAVGVFDTGWPSAVLAGLGSAGIVRLGWLVIAGLAQPVPAPPEPGQLRKVKLVYRCAICGAEVRMTVAATEDPEPPRHCQEDMELITPIE